MGTEDNGLSLEGLADKLEALQRESAERLETLERENAELRDEVATLRGSGTRQDETRSLVPRRDGERASEFEGRVSRRSLLSKAGAAAVAVAAAGMLLNPREAKAHHYTDQDYDWLKANRVLTHRVEALNGAFFAVIAETTSATDSGVWAKNRGSGAGVLAESASGSGVIGRGDSAAVNGIASGISGTGVEGEAKGSNGTGVKGTGRYGVWGESNQAGFHGVTGRNTRTNGTGVRGVGAGSGVKGESINSNGHGVHGKGKNGVFGESSTPGQNGVWGQHTNQGAGVSGVGRVGVIGFSHENGWNAVWGRHTTNGRGVAGDSAKGVGVLGESTSGIGGEFKGGKAQLRLVPGSTGGKPASGTHTKGELYMDKAARLFVCVADGSPGTWRKVTVS